MTTVSSNKYSLNNLKNEGENQNQNLLMLVCGPRGVGKSSFIGTMNQPTLLITSFIEKHSVKAAMALSENPKHIMSLYIDRDNGVSLPDKQAYDRTLEILDWALQDYQVRKEVKVIAFDGLSAIDLIIQNHPSVVMANNFEKSKITQLLFMTVIRKLRELNENFHVICTMPCTYSYDSDGDVNAAKIDLTGIAVSSAITGVFDQLTPLVQIDGKSMISFDICITKSGKSIDGTPKNVSFFPRLNGFKKEELQSLTEGTFLFEPDASLICKLYEMKKNGKLNKIIPQET